MPKNVSLNALRVLATVSQTHSFKLAAQRLGVTQSAISRQIQTLEEQLGTRLIQRDNRVHALTPTGSLLAPELNRMFTQLDELISSVAENKAADNRTLTVALADPVLSYLVAPRLDEFYALYPHLTLEFKSCPEYLTDQVEQQDAVQHALLQDTWDIVIGCGDLASKQIASQVIAPLRYQILQHNQRDNQRVYSVVQSDDLLTTANAASTDSDNDAPLTQAPVRQVESTGAALALCSGQGGFVHLPSFMAAEVIASLPLQPTPGAAVQRSKHNLYLRCFYPRHKERELAVVAFSNWLAHIGSSL